MSLKKEIILVGGGGHCKACIDVIEQEGNFVIRGIIDLPEKIGHSIMGYPIIDSDDNLDKVANNYKNFLITIGFIKNSEIRNKLFKEIKSYGGIFPTITSPRAYVSKHATIEEGTIVMHGAVINAESKIGNNCIINNLSLIEHDAKIGNNSHISTGARINGACELGENCFIGSGSIVNHGIRITSNVIVASGSLVRKDIRDYGLYSGNPSKKYK